jgi:cytochrome-b5 reductase
LIQFRLESPLADKSSVYNVTDYVRDHPGGVDVLLDLAGKDATEGYEDVGHSEDADEILRSYLIGVAADSNKARKAKAVKLVQQSSPLPTNTRTWPASSIALTVVLASVAVAVPAYYASQRGIFSQVPVDKLPSLALIGGASGSSQSPFLKGFAIATLLSSIAFAVVGKELAKFTHVEEGFGRYPPYRKARPRVARPNPHLARGFLDAKEYKPLKVSKITKLSPNVFKYTFALPAHRDVIGLPIGQHVAIKATIDGKTVTRSYTPTSNNIDTGVLELVIKIYPDGALTGKYFANLKVGDEVLFRGPKGAMKYTTGHCKHIGMIAGGTGITPMYALIRSICEDPRDTTSMSLVYANRTEDDILLRSELETFARRYPKNFKVWFMLDSPPAGWTGGSGFVTREVMKEKLPAVGPDTKIMLCGPPGMIGAAKKGLVDLGFKEPGAAGKMADEIFCF